MVYAAMIVPDAGYLTEGAASAGAAIAFELKEEGQQQTLTALEDSGSYNKKD